MPQLTARGAGIAVAFGMFFLGSRAISAQVVISEFLASNTATLVDEDGEFADFIEIYNTGRDPVNLQGWALTDDGTAPKKWTFPARELAPGTFLVVFASGKDRRDPEGELHTNFQLEKSGEFLGLSNPEGEFSSIYAPTFPEQLPDTSYGSVMNLTTVEAIGAETSLRWFVPADESADGLWTDPAFDDAAWQTGTNGLGFDVDDPADYAELIRTDVSTAVHGINSSVYVRTEFDVPGEGYFPRLLLRYDDGAVIWLNGVEVARENLRGTTVDWDARALRTRREEDAVLFAEIALPAVTTLPQGRNVLAIQLLNSRDSDDDLLLEAKLELRKIESVDLLKDQYFPRPSPVAPNADGRDEVAPPPVFSTKGGTFAGSIQLELSTELEGAEIRYTLDGSAPVESSPLYTGPISVTDVTRLQAKTFATGFVPSKTQSEFYVPTDPSVVDDPRLGIGEQGSELPILIINVPGGQIVDPVYNYCDIAEIRRGEGERTRFTDPFVVTSRAGIKLHGSSSQGFAKKNFRLETRDDAGEDRDVPLGGLPSESDWVLHGPYSDKSLIRNALSYEWSTAIGQYSPRTRLVELWLKTSAGPLRSIHYHGVYLVVERIKQGPNRVDIDKVLPGDDSEPAITGGYIFKKDREDGAGELGFRTTRGYDLRYVDPKEAELTPVQKNWVVQWFRQMEAALYGANFTDPENGYARYLDVDSFIDHQIIVELCKNIDGYRLSTFMHKKRNGKLFMGPVWDYNLSLGNANYLNGAIPSGWYHDLVGGGDYPWYQRLHQDPAYMERYRARWILHRGTALALHNLMASIDRDVELIDEAQSRNFQKWRILGTYIWPNQYIASTWAEEIDWMSNFWLVGRLEWMDSQFIQPPRLSHEGGPVEAGLQVTIDSPDGPAWYTLNGPDPASESGGPAPEAVEYSGPITISENTRLRVRSRIGELGWSGLVEASYVTDPLPIVITEIMYNPPDGDEEGFRSSDFEFLEFQNIGDEPLDVTGVRLATTRLSFEFESGASLAPGEHVVAVKDLAAFRARYGDAPAVAGVFNGVLSNSRMDILLVGPLDEPLLSFTYEDWYPETDGEGASLVIVDPYASRSTWGDSTSWKPSAEIGGSPGRADGSGGGGRRKPSDANGDGKLNISDPVALLRYLFTGTFSLPCDTPEGNVRLLDANADGELNLSDAVQTLDFLFLDGPAPALGTACVEIEGCTTACPN